jgi:hypothetical protein
MVGDRTGLLRIVGVLPGMTIPSFAVAPLWMLLAMIVAVRQALDYTSTRRRNRCVPLRMGARDDACRSVRILIRAARFMPTGRR